MMNDVPCLYQTCCVLDSKAYLHLTMAYKKTREQETPKWLYLLLYAGILVVSVFLYQKMGAFPALAVFTIFSLSITVFLLSLQNKTPGYADRLTAKMMEKMRWSSINRAS